jgi:hypothetical protein
VGRVDADSTIAAVYETVDDIRRDLIESGLPLDHPEAPRLLKTIDVQRKISLIAASRSQLSPF